MSLLSNGRASAACRWMAALILVTWLASKNVHAQQASEVTADDAENYFTRELMNKYGSNHKQTMTSAQLDNLTLAIQNAILVVGREKDVHAHTNHVSTQRPNRNCSGLQSEECIKAKCLDSRAIFDLFGFPANHAANASQIQGLATSVIYQLQNDACYPINAELTSSHVPSGMRSKRSKPTTIELWGFGLLAVTIINVCAALGVLFYPIMKTQFYKRILMAMVGLAVGSLSASAVLVLIPESLELMGDDSGLKDVYQWRMMVVLGGLYLFFTVERILDALVKRGQKRRRRSLGLDNPAYEVEIKANGHSNQEHSNGRGHSHSSIELEGSSSDSTERTHKCWAPLSTIKPVAWMVVFGDALHNFVDGVSLGAAFSQDVWAGVSLSLAVICEELPHELGDFAVLLASGMGVCQALLMNILSGMTCYLGLVVGIQVGSMENGAIYIFALAAGMFLYISLVDMLPEMNAQAREVESEGGSVCVVYILQNVGLLAGWVIILLLVLYSDRIEIGG